MCRLALFNAASLALTDTCFGNTQGALAAFFWDLEQALGGDGIGVAALWMGPRQRVQVRKGIDLSVERAAAQVVAWQRQGADWFLFHSRRATTGRVCTRHCHPFRSGRLVLAHNGHDPLWARLGEKAAGGVLTDSETIARTWAALGLGPEALCDLRGAFVGFQAGHPFVAKDEWSDLRGAEGAEGALLFASHLPRWLEQAFEVVWPLREYFWHGGATLLHHAVAEGPAARWRAWNTALPKEEPRGQ